ncbi:MAG: hypothetical protein DDG60_00760 [Anaerolineae bacterium]|nr:MAG: hypothetical protein DDG60_00760 [Anaerolineae bacterium]
MKTREYLPEEKIDNLYRRARRLVVGDADFDLDQFLHLGGLQLGRLAEVYRRRAAALDFCAKARRIERKLFIQKRQHEAERIGELIRGLFPPGEADRYFLYGEDDGGQLDCIFEHLLTSGILIALVGMDDEEIKKAFSHKEIYFDIYEYAWYGDAFRKLVTLYAALGE